MKTFLPLAVAVSIALAQSVGAEDQDQVKAPKSRPKASQPAPAPHVAPKIQRGNPSNAVPPNANQRPRPVPQPAIQPVSRPRAQANPPAYPKLDEARTLNKAPRTTATIEPVVTTHRNWDNGRNGNNSNWRNRHSYNNSWAEACRRHGRHHHHRDWWRSHYTRFALFGTGYYFWDNGYWFPAYGYDSAYNVYEYEEPIYGGDLEPGQVIANVQTELQRLGYFPYAVDGTMGPMTRAAIANYQRDMGLSITSAIDEPTLLSLGLD